MAETENYSRAGQQLYMSQPNVYVQLRNLERELGCRLFEQQEKRAVLTEAGRALLDYAAEMLDLEEDVRWVLGELPHNYEERLVVGATPAIGSYLLPGLLASFKQGHPGVYVAIEMYSGRKQLKEDLLRFSNDLTFVTTRPPTPYTIMEEIWRSDLVLCVGQGHRLAREDRVVAADLAAEDFVWLQYHTLTRRKGEAALRRLGISPRLGMIVANTEAAKRVIAENWGVAIVPRFVLADELASGQLRVLDLPGFRVDYPLFWVRHKAKSFSQPAQAFLAMVRDAVASGRWDRYGRPASLV